MDYFEFFNVYHVYDFYFIVSKFKAISLKRHKFTLLSNVY